VSKQAGERRSAPGVSKNTGTGFFLTHPFPLLLTFRTRSQFCYLRALLKVNACYAGYRARWHDAIPFFERYFKSDLRYWHFLLASTSLKVTKTTTTTKQEEQLFCTQHLFHVTF